MSEEERTFYENKNNEYNGGYNVQNNHGEGSSGPAVTIAPKTLTMGLASFGSYVNPAWTVCVHDLRCRSRSDKFHD